MSFAPASAPPLEEDALYRRLLFVTFLLGALVFYWGLGDIALLSFNEARRAVPAEGMFRSGDWLLPRLNGELYLAKPPLLYWLAAACAWLFGATNEWAVRLPSALAASLCVWVCYRHARRVFGSWPALFATQILIANAGFAVFARRAEIEMLLTTLCVASLLAALRYVQGEGGRAWLWLSYGLLGLAMLTKGPLVLLFVTLPLLALALSSRGTRHWQALYDPLGWLIFLLVGLSWYAVVTWKLGWDVWTSIIQVDMVDKIQESTSDPFYDYIIWIVGDFFPVSLLLLIRPITTVRRWWRDRDCKGLLLAVAIPFLLYSLFSNKHAKYLLPIYPLLALLLGKRLAELLETGGARLRRTVLALGIALPALYALYFGLVESKIYDYRVAVFPQFTQWLHTAPALPLFGYHDLDERLLYYAQRDIPVIDDARLQELRTHHPDMMVLAEGSDAEKIAPQADCRLRTFTPYLKRSKTLTVFGFGVACGKESR
ncbi:ArnT family glycosyltransferase [Tepidiphilus olei]|uniref:ArnT family glycosyltransferase n=1 Tax=Tepidiphilus olei TaxID=2502184 RepID=UPI00115D40AE|nr:glycosyltransferase family 39 protein [Tepidiphilus olei]